MFGDDPLDVEAVAASIAQSAADPERWLEQGYQLKRLADELIQRWLDTGAVMFEAIRDHHTRFPVRDRMGDRATYPPGFRESEARMEGLRSLSAEGSPEVYMMLAGQAVENLVKGLYVREHPEVVRSAEHVAGRGSVLAPPVDRHGTLDLLGAQGLGFELSEEERNIAKRLELAVTWHGRYPIPKRAAQARVDPLDDHEESNSLGFWSSSFRSHVDALYERLFAELAEPDWFAWWEPDKYPSY